MRNKTNTERRIQTHRGEGDMKQSRKTCGHKPRDVDVHKKPEEARNKISLEPPGRDQLPSLFKTSAFQNCKEKNLLFKPPNLG